MFRLAALVALLITGSASAQSTAPTQGDDSLIEPPGACIYRVAINGNLVTVTYNFSPCPQRIRTWLKKDAVLPRGTCGLEIGSEPAKHELNINPVPCDKDQPSTPLDQNRELTFLPSFGKPAA